MAEVVAVKRGHDGGRLRARGGRDPRGRACERGRRGRGAASGGSAASHGAATSGGSAASAATAGLVLAAGEGRRFGGPKQLALVGGRPLRRARARGGAPASTASSSCSARARRRSARGADLGGAEVVVCADWAEGMGASVRCGLAALAGADRVRGRARRPAGPHARGRRARVLARPGPAARAVYAGRPGHPVVLRPQLLARAGELRGDAGFRDLLAGVARGRVRGPGGPADIDTREDLEVVQR